MKVMSAPARGVRIWERVLVIRRGEEVRVIWMLLRERVEGGAGGVIAGGWGLVGVVRWGGCGVER